MLVSSYNLYVLDTFCDEEKILSSLKYEGNALSCVKEQKRRTKLVSFFFHPKINLSKCPRGKSRIFICPRGKLLTPPGGWLSRRRSKQVVGSAKHSHHHCLALSACLAFHFTRESHVPIS